MKGMIIAHIIGNPDTHYAIMGIVFVSVSIGAAIVLIIVQAIVAKKPVPRRAIKTRRTRH